MADVDKELDAGFEFLNQGEFNKAKLRFNKVIKETPEDPRGYVGLAQAAVGLPKMSMVEVAELYRKAISLDPEDPMLYVEYGEFCLENGLLRPAEDNYLKAAELDPDDAPLYYHDLSFGFADAGIKFIERQTMDKDEVLRKALEYKQKAFGVDDAKARDICEKLKADAGRKDEPEPNMNGVRKVDGAAELLGLLEDEPGNPYLRLELGQLCCDNGYVVCGEKFFLEAVSIDPENAKYYYNDLAAAVFFGGMGNIGKAEASSEDEILRTSFKYSLRAFKIDEVKAVELLS